MSRLEYVVGLALDTIKIRSDQERYVVMYDNGDIHYLSSSVPTMPTPVPYIHVRKNDKGTGRCFLHNASSEQWRLLRNELKEILAKHNAFLLFVEPHVTTVVVPDEALLAGKNWQNSPAFAPVLPNPTKARTRHRPRPSLCSLSAIRRRNVGDPSSARGRGGLCWVQDRDSSTLLEAECLNTELDNLQALR